MFEELLVRVARMFEELLVRVARMFVENSTDSPAPVDKNRRRPP